MSSQMNEENKRWSAKRKSVLLVKESFRYFYFIDTVQNGFAIAIANAIYLSIYVWFYF